MTVSLSTQMLESAFQWLTTSGLRVMAVGFGMLVLLAVARGTTSRLRKCSRAPCRAPSKSSEPRP